MTADRIRIANLRRSFAAHEVLTGVSFDLQMGGLYGLIGPSGSGKSVLLKAIAGVDMHAQGEVDLGGMQPDEMSLMFQEGALFDSLSVFDNIAFPLVSGNVPVARLDSDTRAFLAREVERVLAHVGLVDAANKFPGQLSGGMRRRVSLARALISRPKFALLDDPTAGLDPVASSVIMDLIVRLHKEYRPTMLVVSQDLRRLLPIVERIYALFDGRIRFRGSLDELRESELDYLREFVSCRYDLAA